MAKVDTSWKVLPHGPLQQLADNLWRVEGGLENMPLKRVMTVARLQSGGLLVHNAIAMSEDEMAKLDALGKVAYIVVPNAYHRLDAPRFAARYPEARIVSPKGSRKKVEEKLPVHLTYDQFPSDSALSLAHLGGLGEQEGVLTVRSSDGVSLVFNDALFNMPHQSGFQGFVLRYITQSSGDLHVSRIARLFIVKDRAAFRAHVERLADTPDLKRVLVSHHQTVHENVASALRAAVSAL